MQKKVFGKKLGRNTNSRKALFRSLVRELVVRGSITTTLAKAKAVQPLIDKVMTKAKSGSLSDQRKVLALLGNDRKTTETIFKNYGDLLKSRNSGFTKTTKLPKRRGDNVISVKLEWSQTKNDENVSTKTK